MKKPQSKPKAERRIACCLTRDEIYTVLAALSELAMSRGKQTAVKTMRLTVGFYNALEELEK